MTTLKRAFVCAALGAAISASFSVAASAADGKNVAYVSNQDGGVTVIDLDTMETTGTISVEAKEPRGIGITRDGKYLVTANRDGGDVSIIDTATRKVIKHIPIGKNPEFVRVYGNHAYVSYEPSAKAGPPPKDGKDDDDDGNKLPAGIAVVDLKEWKVLRTIMSGPETEGIEFSDDGKLMLVTNEGDNTVTVYELPEGKQVKTIETKKFGERPRGIKAAPDGQSYVVTLEYGDKFLLIDKDLNPVKTIATGKTPYGIAFDKAGKRIFVATSREKKLQVFDAKTHELIKSMPSGDRCWHFSFTPDESKILLACGKSNDVHVFDSNTLMPIKKITGKSSPWGIVVYPKAMGSLDAP